MRWLAQVFASAFVRKLGYVAAVAAVAFASQCAHAGGLVPMAQSAYVYQLDAGPFSYPNLAEGDREGACTSLAAALQPYSFYNGWGPVFNPTADVSGNGGAGSCTVKDTWGYSRTSTPSCPPHSTAISATQCSCTDPYGASGSTCVPPAGDCAVSAAKPLGVSGQSFSAPTSGGVRPSQVCSNGCGYIPRSTGPGAGLISSLGGAQTYTASDSSQWIGLGTSCTPSDSGAPGTPENPAEPYPQPLKAGTCPGEVNGVAVVVACDTTSTSSANSPAGAASSASSTASSPSGTAGNTSNKDTATTCTASACTTTTTTTTNNPDGTTTTTTETEGQDKGDFCSEHPGNPQCDGEDEKGKCEGVEGTLGCLEVGTVPTAAAITGVTVNASIAAQSGWGADNGSCPAAIHTQLLGNVDPYALFCTYAAGIRFIVIGFASIVALMIFLGRMD